MIVIRHDIGKHIVELPPEKFVAIFRDDISEALNQYVFYEHHEQYPYFPSYERVTEDVKESFFANKDNYNSYTKNPWKITDGVDFDECYHWL